MSQLRFEYFPRGFGRLVDVDAGHVEKWRLSEGTPADQSKNGEPGPVFTAQPQSRILNKNDSLSRKTEEAYTS